MNAVLENTGSFEDITIGEVYEEIERLLALSLKHLAHGRNDFAAVLARQAWREYLPLQEVLNGYLGCDDLGSRLVSALSALDNPLALENDRMDIHLQPSLSPVEAIAA